MTSLGSPFSLAATCLSEKTGQGHSRISAEDNLKGFDSSNRKDKFEENLSCSYGLGSQGSQA
jgi:hypothetical protein